MESKKLAKKKAPAKIKMEGEVLWLRESWAGPVFPRVEMSTPNNLNFTMLIGKKSKIVITITD